jgi:hypothetical protein
MLAAVKDVSPAKPMSILVRSFHDVDEYTMGWPAPNEPGARVHAGHGCTSFGLLLCAEIARCCQPQWLQCRPASGRGSAPAQHYSALPAIGAHSRAGARRPV